MTIAEDTSRSPIILNVDDDEANRYAVSRILRHAGYTVEEAWTGEDAVTMAARLRPDLVVLDIRLPDIDGYEVCRRLRERPETKDTPVVHLTAHATTPGQRVLGLEGGAAAYLTRPLESRELVATISALLGVRRAERVARRVAREWQATFDALPEIVYVLDAQGAVTRRNVALSGRPSTDLSNLSHEDLLESVLGRPLAPHERIDPRTLDDRAERDLVAGERVYRWTLDPIRDEVEGVIGTVGILADVTERRRLAAEIERRNAELVLADRRKDEFLAMLAHELRNPLGAIGNAVALLEMELTPGDRVGARVRDVVKRQTRHLARLVDDLLDVSRFNQGKIELRRAPIDLGAVVEDAVSAVRSLLDARGHHVRVASAGERLMVDGDAVRLEQIVLNLLDNAAKYTAPGGHVALELSRDGGHARLRVVDDGIGIDPSRLDSIFDAFVQVDPSFDRARGGLGVGLTLVRRLVELHGGTVSAHSEGLGHGTRFDVRIPLLRDEDRPATEPEADVATASTKARVLLVEDSDDNRSLLRTVLEYHGHEVSEATDGESGVQRALEERPEVAVIDLGLPGLDGFEVARRIRAVMPRGSVRLIALTGYGSGADRRRALDAGFDEHLVKPIDPTNLVAALELPAAPRIDAAAEGRGASSA